ncbi:MAG: hypothetical protein ACW97X_05345 [Candidatus Hodarchaeales archaeon]|jgi:hypothetical protein
MIPLDYVVLFFAVPGSMIIITTIKQDKWNLAWIIPWSLLLFIGDNAPFDVALFILGLIIGYFSDFAGVKSEKWWYPEYKNRIFSLSAGYGWGIITLIIFRTYFYIQIHLQILEIFIYGIFGILWFIVELKKGKTSISTHWLTSRSIITIIFLLISGDIYFLFVAAIGAIYLEVLGTELKVWVYRMDKPSYIHLGIGYAQLSYLCLIYTKLIIFQEIPSMMQIFLIAILIILYILDYLQPSVLEGKVLK